MRFMLWVKVTKKEFVDLLWDGVSSAEEVVFLFYCSVWYIQQGVTLTSF